MVGWWGWRGDGIVCLKRPPRRVPSSSSSSASSSSSSSVQLWRMVTGRKPTGGERGASARRVCMQALINRAPPPSSTPPLSSSPAWHPRCMPPTCTACIELCVCVCLFVCVCKRHNMSAVFVPALPPSQPAPGAPACPPVSALARRPRKAPPDGA